MKRIFSYFKRRRRQHLKEKITLQYLSNPVTFQVRDDDYDIKHINALYHNVINTK